ncbi:hypothetical protein D9615_004371 [Tricholomella constricta]|uniref:CCHC-type domain-containing protein n=1 Tax=Tricholomella constricta TaxID=117010 RepID=A0A8H5HF53_9AGAR|nr:hypothetical protein D9615_004371 [Tricholomella constricta]
MADPFAPTGSAPPPSRAHSTSSRHSGSMQPPTRAQSTPAHHSGARTSSGPSTSSVPNPHNTPIRTPPAVVSFPAAGITWSHTLPRLNPVESRLIPAPSRKPYSTIIDSPAQIDCNSSYHPPPTPSPVPRDFSPAYMHHSVDPLSSRPHSSAVVGRSPPLSSLPLATVPISSHSHSSHTRLSSSHSVPAMFVTSSYSPATPSLLRRSLPRSPPPLVQSPLHVRLDTPLAPQPRYPIAIPTPPSPAPARTPLFYPSPVSSHESRHSRSSPSHVAPSVSVLSLPHSVRHTPVPTSSPTIPVPPTYNFTETKLPSTAHIPLLTRPDDWPDWYSGVQSTIEHTGLWAFVAPDPLPGAFSDPASIPTFPPFVDFAVHGIGSPELEAYQAWWRLDDVVSYIITSRLGNVPRRLLPLEKRDAYGHRISSSRGLLLILREKYGVGHAAAADLIKTSTLTRKAHSVAGIVGYVTSWQQAVMQTQSTRWPFSYYEQVQKFVDGLPHISAFDTLRASVRLDVERLEEDRQLTFDYLSNEVLKIEMDLRRLAISHPPQRRPNPSASLATTSTSASSASTDPAPSATTTPSSTSDRPICDNCGSYGHLRPNCWRPGGGDEGGKERFLAQKAASRPTALVTTSESDRPLSPVVESAAEAPIDLIDLYTVCSPESPADDVSIPSLPPYTDFVYATDSVALFSLSSRFNALLDSGCTVHIIRDRDLFWTYDSSQAVSVGTANCGVLPTLAKGEVRFKTVLDGKEVVYRLRECLHAPDAPINLLSVGSMTELGTRLTFDRNSTTVHFPASKTRLSGHTIDATVIRRLSFLSCDFIRPASSLEPVDLADAVVLPAVALQESDLRFPRPSSPTASPSPALVPSVLTRSRRVPSLTDRGRDSKTS